MLSFRTPSQCQFMCTTASSASTCTAFRLRFASPTDEAPQCVLGTVTHVFEVPEVNGETVFVDKEAPRGVTCELYCSSVMNGMIFREFY